MTDGLQLAGPVMGRRTRFNANDAPRQTGEKIQHPGPADPLADHHRAQPINPVNLEHRLRYIQTNRDNLAHGRLPSKWFASAQPPYGTPVPQSGRAVHSIKSGLALRSSPIHIGGQVSWGCHWGRPSSAVWNGCSASIASTGCVLTSHL